MLHAKSNCANQLVAIKQHAHCPVSAAAERDAPRPIIFSLVFVFTLDTSKFESRGHIQRRAESYRDAYLFVCLAAESVKVEKALSGTQRS